MRIKINRGTHEIGGTCIEIIAENGKRLWLDIGSPLQNTNTDINYIKSNIDAVLISHPHQDHYGLIDEISESTPVYIGKISLALINATRAFRGIPIYQRQFSFIKAWETFRILDTFEVTTFLVDHSSPESFAFIIEADKKRVFYSGDLRATGRKNILYHKMLKSPPQNIDLMLLEGTMISRKIHKYKTEHDVERELTSIIKEQKNMSFLISSSQNIDRLVSVYKACKRNRKKLILDIYTSWVLQIVSQSSPKLPTIEWPDIYVYKHPLQYEIISDSGFDIFREKINRKIIGNKLFLNPSDYVEFVRCPNEKLIDAVRKHGVINIIYSQWEGYLSEDFKNSCFDTINKLRDDNSINFSFVHTTGHAIVNDLVKLADSIKPKKLVPIHTNDPQNFLLEFTNRTNLSVETWNDNVEYYIK